MSTAWGNRPTVWSPLARGFEREWRYLRFFALLLAAAVTPASYRPSVRAALAQAVCFAAGQALPGYALFSVLAAMVTAHLVVVSAASYGLSHLALEALVRVYVVELLPLLAALFVAMRSGIAVLDHLAGLRAQGERLSSGAAFLNSVLPAFLANLFATLLLTLTSCLIALFVTYLVVHGLTPWGLAGFSWRIGQVFDPVTLPGFLLKTALFGLAVGAAPATVALEAPRRAAAGSEMRAMARLFLALALIEAASLIVLRG
ncbi:MAG: ABC transporter permease [Rhodocyclaceae bacterium]|nr:ABC transporter permease [Rhodocyclaceae bacterium]